MIREGIKFTDYQKRVIEYVEKYEEMNHCKPFVYQISDELKSVDKRVSDALNKIYDDYPSNKMVTTVDKKMFDSFEEGMTIRDLANNLGLGYDNVYNHSIGIQKLGVKFKTHKEKEKRQLQYQVRENRLRKRKAEIKRVDLKPKKQVKPSKTEEKLVGVKIVHGLYKGKYGYLDDESKVVIHVDGEPKAIEIESFDYVEIKC